MKWWLMFRLIGQYDTAADAGYAAGRESRRPVVVRRSVSGYDLWYPRWYVRLWRRFA